MNCYWVYFWCYAPAHGSCNPECQIQADTSIDAVVAAMQWLRLPSVDYAYVHQCGVVEVETFSAVSLPDGVVAL